MIEILVVSFAYIQMSRSTSVCSLFAPSTLATFIGLVSSRRECLFYRWN